MSDFLWPESLLSIFDNFLKKNKIPHTILLAGPQKLGKKTFAKNFAKYLFFHQKEDFFSFMQKECQCKDCEKMKKGKFPDFFEISPEKEIISIEKIRELRKKISFSSFSFCKIVLIDEAEKMTKEAASAFLKILEEPRGKTIFFLVSSFPSTLLKTILSRSEIIKFHPFSKKNLINFFKNEDEKFYQEKIELSLGRPALLKDFFLDENKFLLYNFYIEKIGELKKMSSEEKMSLGMEIAQNKEKDVIIDLIKVYFLDVIKIKEGIENINFETKKEKMKKNWESFSLNKIKEYLKKIEKVHNLALFSKVSKGFLFEGLFLSL